MRFRLIRDRVILLVANVFSLRLECLLHKWIPGIKLLINSIICGVNTISKTNLQIGYAASSSRVIIFGQEAFGGGGERVSAQLGAKSDLTRTLKKSSAPSSDSLRCFVWYYWVLGAVNASLSLHPSICIFGRRELIMYILIAGLLLNLHETNYLTALIRFYNDQTNNTYIQCLCFAHLW